MARTVLVAGTASHVGKSTVAAGLCRALARRGVTVAPFKAQNMSNNARVAPAPDGGWGEIGVSQHVQARAAGVPPTTDVNPVLLKPRGAGESQLVVDGEAVCHLPAGAYYEDHWDRAREAAAAAHRRLAADHEVVVAEGAGSIAEPNLRERDLANLETARFADADVVLVADIERGGAFASLVGALELVPDDVRERVVGAVVNKFRGDRELLRPAVEEVEARTGVPVLGVLPHDDPGLPAEDSLSLPARGERAVRGGDDGVPDDRSVTVAAVRLPRISNATDLEPLVREPGVRVAYVPPEDPLDDADALVLPGTKNTVDDLRALRAAGFGESLASFDGPVVGICGGYQLLGERIANAERESTAATGTVAGFGLLPVETAFAERKRVVRTDREVRGVGPIAGAEGRIEGYEIHAGETTVADGVPRPLGERSAATDRVLGTYLHGLFESRPVREAFLEATFEAAGVERPAATSSTSNPFDAAADLLEDHLDLDALVAGRR